MAAAHGTATHLPAGSVATSALATADEAREYERILKISDEIFSGSHPRLKVPQQFVRKSGARNAQTAPASQAQVAKSRPLEASSEKASVPEGTKTRQPQSSQPPSAGNVSSTVIANAAPSSSHIVPKPASEINPIFLTKSDDLVRAEIQLQRQRVERALREQLEQKRQENKQKAALQDSKPEFDVSQVLNRALEIVKPITLSDSEANAPGAASDSFDDNSFYSSRAPDSPPQMGDHQKPSPLAPSQPAGPAPRVRVDNYADELQRLEALNPPGSDQEMQDAYPVADQRALYQKQPYHGQDLAAESQQQVEIQEEPEYSPPEPRVLPMDVRDDRYERPDVEEKRRRLDGRYLDQPRESRRQPSPANDVRVVQNHITSPAAPRPSLVSPLATAKISSIQQYQDEEHGLDQVHSDPDSRRDSPNPPAPTVVSRKRRRLQGEREGPRHASYRKNNADPPETYIKEEPVSPPPFADSPAVLRSRHPPERPMYIDVASPRYTPVVERRAPSVREQVYEVDGYRAHPLESGPPRTISRLSARPPVRDEGDLRRVASLQYARQAEYPREYIETNSRPVRSASYTVIERPPQEQLRYYDAPPGHRYVTANELPPLPYREPYNEEVAPERIMAPPPRRIVVDEHGNQYYEILPAPRMEPMPPPSRPVSRMSRGDVYEDVPLRSASMRAPSIVQDAYGEGRYVQEKPPPQPVYGRVPADYARPANAERRVYATPIDSHAAYSRSGSAQVAEYLPRRTTYLQEYAPLPSERVIRTSSVRPPGTRYEEPSEVNQRVESVRPAGHTREAAFYVDDRHYPEYRREHHPPGEYWDQQFYVPATRPVRERRHYEDDSAGNLVQGAPQRH